MGMRKRWARVGVLVWIVLWGCDAPSLQAPAGELRINLRTEPPTLDWTLATDNVSILVIEQLVGMQQSTRPIVIAFLFELHQERAIRVLLDVVDEIGGRLAMI